VVINKTCMGLLDQGSGCCTIASESPSAFSLAESVHPTVHLQGGSSAIRWAHCDHP
jgi:hypothetical protein